MHHSEPLSLIFKAPEQGFGGKICQNASQGNHQKAKQNTLLKLNKLKKNEPASVAQLDARPTADQDVAGSATFFHGD